MSIFLNKDSRVIVQGITGGEGTTEPCRPSTDFTCMLPLSEP